RSDRQRRIVAQGRMNQIKVMHPEVSHLAAGIIVEPAETIEAAILIVRDFRRGTEPAFPVEICGWSFVRRMTNAMRPFVLNVEGPRDGDFTDAAVTDKFGELAAEGNGAAMDANLANALVLPDGLDHATS